VPLPLVTLIEFAPGSGTRHWHWDEQVQYHGLLPTLIQEPSKKIGWARLLDTFFAGCSNSRNPWYPPSPEFFGRAGKARPEPEP
jgi:hypothetical protein